MVWKLEFFFYPVMSHLEVTDDVKVVGAGLIRREHATMHYLKPAFFDKSLYLFSRGGSLFTVEVLEKGHVTDRVSVPVAKL